MRHGTYGARQNSALLNRAYKACRAYRAYMYALFSKKGVYVYALFSKKGVYVYALLSKGRISVRPV